MKISSFALDCMHMAGSFGHKACLNENNAHKKVFEAWLWMRLARKRCRPGDAIGPPQYDPKAQFPLDDLLARENARALQNPRAEFPYLNHCCDTMGCAGRWPLDALEDTFNDAGTIYNCVIVDGVQTLAGQACSSHGCIHAPLPKKRFCELHRDLERLCAAHIGPRRDDYCQEQCREGHQTCEAHAMIERDYGGPVPTHYQRPRYMNEGRNEWRGRYNEYWRERKKHRYALV